MRRLRQTPANTNYGRTSRRLRPGIAAVAALSIATVALVAGLALGLRGQAEGDPEGAQALAALLERAGTVIVFSEFGADADTLWAANPDDPADRVRLGDIAHAPGYGISPSLSPDGAYVTYNILPAGAPAAELWLFEVATGETRRLAQNVDLVSAPVWSAKADALGVRRSSGGEGDAGSVELLRVDLSGNAEVIAAAEGGLYAIEFSPDGRWFYFASLSPAGTDLARAPASGGGAAESVAHLSDGLTRDWDLSPDGERLAYLAQASSGSGAGFAVHVLDLGSGAIAAPLGSAGGQFSPVWEDDGVLAIGRLAGAGAGAPARVSVDGDAAGAAPLPAPDAGFDVPLSWSPAAAYLVVRHFEGTSTADPGPSWVVLLDAAGERRQLSPLSDVELAGWLTAEG